MVSSFLVILGGFELVRSILVILEGFELVSSSVVERLSSVRAVRSVSTHELSSLVGDLSRSLLTKSIFSVIKVNNTR